ncbi:Cobalt-zinc-cadmium resistance protein CzcD [Fulvivirga imtechensis AK7]|uniref:Cobalt-zinc-cadmium resistance protein CzcD n=1 Tax=Fulvivirga imtechensis AK7 TaxID=1237149 RepID=L8JY18_9BACT|nr:cation diffusion facilitator family transporter [Fulvivirga imtechensis]ELR72107.1 Cobalt-zinc-cadmium resistance protein CzcD [Fulvivirga imtechensis AK7]
MGHNHDHVHHHHGTKNLKVAFFLNLGFTIIEIVGGLLTNSVAILSDALHDLGDSLSLGLSWYFQYLSTKGRDKTFSYGYGRFSLLGAVINSVVLLAGSAIIIFEAIPRLFNPQQPDAQGMIYLAVLGIIFNGAAVLKLRKGSSINEEVVSLHLLEDVLGWTAVLVGSIIMHFYNAPIIDPILSLMIAGYILINVFKNIKKSFRIILQGTPKDLKIDEIIRQTKEIEHIQDVHDFHLWSMDGEYYVFSAHLVVKKNSTMEELTVIKHKVRDLLKSFKIEHATIEFETEDEKCELEHCWT